MSSIGDRQPAVGQPPPPIGDQYWQRSAEPLQALIFLVPLILFYELGLALLGSRKMQLFLQMNQPIGDIKARRMLFDLFESMGISGYYLPGLAVVVVLLCRHLVRRDPWAWRPGIYPFMWIESLGLALPLFVFGMVVSKLSMQLGAGAEPFGSSGFGPAVVLSIGAGIYEELLFRLIGLAVVHLILVDWLKWPEKWGAVTAITITAVLFALYHFSSDNPFTWGKFTFYTAAGLYFAAVYLVRGFGIVAWTHALYDVLVVVLQMQYRFDQG